ncbi:LADA_0G08020g1_1 [Lachancea dasiensis]|uniref:LADA_0G08020g1_1 n=1 Tax=Lachancea dasiensis TaxID=1072105 RepID=A0A1G4JU11_9SACH|nr:LADA_0G08020g1_1 [Lachancea dasiensis]
MDTPVPLNSRYSYHAIFSDICKTRFNHLATRLLLTLAVVFGLILALVSGSNQTNLIHKLFLWPVKCMVCYLGMLLVVVTRKNYLHVDFPGYSSIITQVYGQLFSVKLLVYFFIYSASSACFNGAAGSAILGHLSSRKNMFAYRFAIWILMPALYALQHVIFDLDKLSFQYGAQHQHPQRFISSKIKNSLTKSFMLTLALAIIFPICTFHLAPSTGYLSWMSFFHIQLSALLTFALWDLVNLSFNAYLSMGCLHKGKPISSLSSTPMETLLTGLSSKRSFTKLTAFQELSYRATSPDIEARLPIYHTRYKNVYVWPSVLKECITTLNSTNSAVSIFMKSVESKQELYTKKPSVDSDYLEDGTQQNDLFGNDYVITANTQSRIPGTPQTQDSQLTHRIKVQNNNVFAKNHNLQFSSPFQFSNAANNRILTHQTTITNIIYDCVKQAKDFFIAFFFPIQGTDATAPLSSFEIWRISKKLQAERLSPLAVCHAECTVSLMALLVKALQEDPKGAVVSSVGEILKILERSVASLGAFAEWNTSSASKDSSILDVVTILYDLSINAFLEIVLKYNDLLSDVYLADDVVKLSKWMLEMCNEQA